MMRLQGQSFILSGVDNARGKLECDRDRDTARDPVVTWLSAFQAHDVGFYVAGGIALFQIPGVVAAVYR